MAAKTSTSARAAKATASARKSATRKKAAPKPKAAKSIARGRPRSAELTSADSVDAQLARYRSMRDFHTTAEPSGSGKVATSAAAARTLRASSERGLPFVIQKHAASHLHYDFRLGWNGVLKSWAVAKGPSYYTGDRRLAVQVEDHPMEYGGFEGIIPKGQYGGGTVMVWDQGTWWPQPGYENVDAGLRNGSLKFVMNGTKMHGKWTLVRMGPKSTSSSGSRWGSSEKPNWLLIKEHDEFEHGALDPPVTDAEPNSAVTGRTIDQIAHEGDHVWNSKETAGTGRSWYRQDPPANGPGNENGNGSRAGSAAKSGSVVGAKFNIRPRRPTSASASTSAHTVQSAETASGNGASHTSPDKARGDGAPKARHVDSALDKLPTESQPAFIPPQLAEEAESPPDTSNWLHELKLDGYRMQARKSGSRVQLLTRKGLDWTHRMRAVADAVAALAPRNLTLDGEVVVLDEKGVSNFANLQASFNEGERYPLTYFCFDLLHLEGRNTRNVALAQRKDLLASVLPETQEGTLRLSEHIEGKGPAIFAKACELQTEGIISKRADAPYKSGRNADWLKSKCLHEQEFVVAGYTDSTEGPDRIGSLILGYYENDSPHQSSSVPLIYAGRTGTGFTQKLKRDLYTRLHKIETGKMPFPRLPADIRRGAHWVKPELVAQVRFATWTADNHVRQAAFMGLREDKSPHEVVREEPTVAPKSRRETTAKPASGKPASGSKAAALSETDSNPSVSTREQKAAAAPAARPTKPAPSAPPSVRITHPDKLLDPESGLTKRQLADYYFAVGDRMLPHIVGRPLSLVRCPEGAGKPCFFQKHVNHMLPPGLGSVMVTDKKSQTPEPYITITPENATPEVVAGLAQMGCLEVHPWGSCNNDLEHPDRIIFDLDPDESLPWTTLAGAAAEVRKRMKRAGLESFLKTTGGKGLHVVAPILPEHDWPTVKNAAHNFVLAMERSNLSLYLTKMTKSARVGKIYLDYLRNERGATAVAAYSPRARVGASVSLPLPWSALKLPARPIFRVAEFDSWRDRLRSDPWKAMPTLKQHLDPAALGRA